jgi:hypothetical protein
MDFSAMNALPGCLAATRFFTTLGLVIAGLLLASTASATLIGDSLEYDGHVKSGAATGVEEYAVAPAFPPITFSLPHINAALTSPLASNANHSLSGSETEINNDFFNSTPASQVIITLQGPGGSAAVVNPLDSGIALPINFDGTFHTSVSGKSVNILHVGIEGLPAFGNNSSFPFDPPGLQTITGLGTAANPLHIHLGIAASQVPSGNANGDLKIHLYYTTSTVTVPEPSTLLMLSTAAMCLTFVAARRRS